MKKIKHIKDIQLEKMQLRIKQLEQEKKIRESWNDLKEQLNPRSYIEHKLADSVFKKSEKGSLVSDVLSYGAALLSTKFAEIAEEKIESTLQKGVEKLVEKINPGHGKK
jgi:predicted RNase H-like nuclease